MRSESINMRKNIPIGANSQLTQTRWDVRGVITASLCALHCLLLPALVTLIPSIGIGAGTVLIQTSEWILFAAATLFVILAAYRGFFWHHHNIMVLIILGSGISMMAFGLIIETKYTGLIHILASIVLISGHIWNASLCRKCKQCRD